MNRKVPVPQRLRIVLALLLAGMVFAMTTESATAAVTTEKVNYNGWKDAIKVANGTVELIIVPSVGRIMFFGYKGGPNLLWENKLLSGTVSDGKARDWRNVGGDKVWPWPQDDWGKVLSQAWPPPAAADSEPQQLEILGKDAVRLTSARVMPWGVRIVREIRMAPTGASVQIDSRLIRETEGEVPPCAPWTVTQVAAAPWVMARLLPKPALPEGFKYFGEGSKFKSVSRPVEGMLLVERNPADATKIGMDADVLATLMGDTLFTVRQAKTPPADNAGLTYLPGDRGQFYSHPDDANAAKQGFLPYIEMEMTAPLKALKKGETVTLSQVWELRRLPEAQRNPAGVATILKTL